MIDFETAARKAAEAIERAKSNAPDEWFLIPITEMTEIITKHYADLAETFGVLCELARLVKNHIDNHGGSITICSWCDYVNKILANPRIAALLAEKKG